MVTHKCPNSEVGSSHREKTGVLLAGPTNLLAGRHAGPEECKIFDASFGLVAKDRSYVIPWSNKIEIADPFDCPGNGGFLK